MNFRTLHATFALSCLVTLAATRDVRAQATQPGATDATGGAPESGGQTSTAILATPSVDPATGLLHTSIPIRAPAARGDAQPGIAIAYASEAGDGYLGSGWDVTTQSIVRSPRSGPPTYEPLPTRIPWTPQDDFYASGVRLMPVCFINSDGSCVGGPAGESIPAAFANFWYFREETETSFNRYFLSRDEKTWVIQSKAGITTELGAPLSQSVTVRAFVPDAIELSTGGVPYRWHIVRKYDAQGDATAHPNAIYYIWKPLVGNANTGGRLYLTDVYDTILAARAYGADFSGSSDFAHHLAFRYEIPWIPATSFVPPAHRAPILQRIIGIDVTSALDTDATKRELVRRYHFSYHSVGRRSYLDSVQLEGRCDAPVYEADTAKNPTLPATSCKTRPATQFSYSESSPVSSTLVVHAFAGSLPNPPVLADVNTDGLPDFLGPSDGTLLPVALNGVLAPDNAAINSAITGEAWDPWAFAQLNRAGDFLTDGKLNVAWVGQDAAGFASPTAAGTTWSWAYSHTDDLTKILLQASKPTNPCDQNHEGWIYPAASHGEIPYETGDVDGDGFPDLLTTTSFFNVTCVHQAACNRYTGQCGYIWELEPQPDPQATALGLHATDRMPDGSFTHFTRQLGNQPPPSWAASVVPATTRYAFVTTSDVLAATRVIPEDMNGDGLVDLIFVAKTGLTFVLGNGDGTVFPGANLGSTLPASVPGLVVSDVSRIYLHDLNGDGMADIVQANDAGFALYLNKDGANFDTPIYGLAFAGDQMSQGAWDLSKIRFLFADMNGSGVDDLVAVSTDSGATSYIDFYQGRRPGLLSQIINGQGGRSTITHDSTTDLAYLAFKAGQPWTRHMAQVLHHVVSVTSDNQLAQPLQQSRTTRYVYRDPIYDARERRFVGFSHVQKTDVGGVDDPTKVVDTTYLSGLCELDNPGTTCPPVNVLDRIYRPLAAHPLLIETSDGNGKYLSTVHFTWQVQQTVAGTNGIVGRFAYAQTSEAFVYDTATPSSGTSPRVVTDACVQGASPCVTETISLHAPAGGFVDVAVSQALSAEGNRTSSVESGVVGVDQAIQTTTIWERPAGDVTGWLWRKQSDALNAFTTPGPFSDEARFVQYAYDAHGNFVSSSEQLQGSVVSLGRRDDEQRAVAPTPATASQNGSLVTSWTYASDPFGNRISRTGSNQGGCETWTYDPLYAQLIVADAVYGGTGGCSGPAMTTTTTHDRGLDAPKMVTQPDLSYVTTTYDIFGRPSVLSKSGTNAPNVASVIYTPGDFEPTLQRPAYTSTQTWDGTGYRTVYAFVDGLGTSLATMHQAAASDAPYTWIVSGTHRLGARGHAVDTFQPFFSKTDPLTLASASAMSLGTLSRHTSYDAFGRVTSTKGLDGAQDSELHYHALSVDTYDAVHLPAATNVAYATSVKDGHGRNSQSIVRGHVGSSTALTTTTTTTAYTVTGQAAHITRSDGKTVVAQDMDYDSLDRLVESRDPNSTNGTSDWRYVYDDFDRLVGTSDPRGCGENISYDSMGRKIGEDFSPCTIDHPDYSHPYLSGSGSEVTYIYDAPFGHVQPAALDGRLYAVLDLAAKTSLAYDLRGRPNHVTRALAKPGAGASTWTTRYAANAFSYDLAYDDANRVTARSTGANALELQVGGQSIVRPHYDERSHIQSVDGSYGPLVTATQFDVDDLPLLYRYGDAAKTAATFDYNGTRRLWHSNIQRTAGWAQATPLGDASTREAALQELTFTYDAVGNPHTVTDKSDSDTVYPSIWPPGAKPIHTRTIGYDDLYHVTSVAYDTGGDTFKQPFDAEFTAQNAGHPGATSPIPALVRANRVTSQTFDYDWMGNLTASDDESKTFFDRSIGTIVNSTVAPNQLVSASNPNGSLSASYDVAGNTTSLLVSRSGACAVGNLCQGSQFLYKWDELGRLSQAERLDLQASRGTSGGFTEQVAFTYSYDAGGSRVLKAATVNGSTTYSAEIFKTLRLDGASWDSTTSAYQDDATTEGVYLVASTAPIARLAYADADPRSGTSGARHVFFELKDVLGSSAFVVDQDTGELVERTTYQPYGAVESDYRTPRWESFREAYKFTEKEEDIGVGIVFFGARYYAPALGRFLSPDPLAIRAHQGDLNPYVYVSGRVFVATDPTGLAAGDPDPIPVLTEQGGLGDDAQAALNAYSQLQQLMAAIDNATQMANQIIDQGQVEAQNGTMGVPQAPDDPQSGPEGPDRSGVDPQAVAVGRDDTRIDKSEDIIVFGNIALTAMTFGEGALLEEGGAQLASALSKAPVADLGAASSTATVDVAVAAGKAADEAGSIAGTNAPGQVTSRGSWRVGTISDAWESAEPGPTGGKACPTCGKEVSVAPGEGPRDWDINHDPAWTKRVFSPDVTRREVLDNYQEGTWLECPTCNRRAGNRR